MLIRTDSNLSKLNHYYLNCIHLTLIPFYTVLLQGGILLFQSASFIKTAVDEWQVSCQEIFGRLVAVQVILTFLARNWKILSVPNKRKQKKKKKPRNKAPYSFDSLHCWLQVQQLYSRLKEQGHFWLKLASKRDCQSMLWRKANTLKNQQQAGYTNFMSTNYQAIPPSLTQLS